LAEALVTLKTERDQADTLRKEAQGRKADAERAAEQLGKKAEELRRQLYGYNVLKADRAIGERNPHELQQLLAACPEDLRRWEWRRLRYLADQSWRTIEAPGLETFMGDLSPDGRTAALVTRDAHLCVYDVARGVELWRRKTGDDLTLRAKFSPDGRQIVTCGFVGMVDNNVKYGLLQTWDSRTGSELWKHQTEGEAFADAKFTLDSQRLLAVGGAMKPLSGRMRLWDVQTHELLWQYARAGELYGAVEIGPQADFAIVVLGDADKMHGLRRWNLESTAAGAVREKEAWSVTIGESNIPVLALDRDGVKTVVAVGPGVLELRDAATGAALGRCAPTPAPGQPISRNDVSEIYSATFDPSGLRIVACNTAGVVRFWKAASRDQAYVLWGHAGRVVVEWF
jgi:WD40 repeat protein